MGRVVCWRDECGWARPILVEGVAIVNKPALVVVLAPARRVTGTGDSCRYGGDTDTSSHILFSIRIGLARTFIILVTFTVGLGFL